MVGTALRARSGVCDSPVAGVHECQSTMLYTPNIGEQAFIFKSIAIDFSAWRIT